MSEAPGLPITRENGFLRARPSTPGGPPGCAGGRGEGDEAHEVRQSEMRSLCVYIHFRVTRPHEHSAGRIGRARQSEEGEGQAAQRRDHSHPLDDRRFGRNQEIPSQIELCFSLISSQPTVQPKRTHVDRNLRDLTTVVIAPSHSPSLSLTYRS